MSYWVNPIPIYWHTCRWYTYTSREPNQVLYRYLLHFAANKFSRTKVYDIYPLAERAFNFPNMAFFRLSPKLVQKHFGNISFMAVWMFKDEFICFFRWYWFQFELHSNNLAQRVHQLLAYLPLSFFTTWDSNDVWLAMMI